MSNLSPGSMRSLIQLALHSPSSWVRNSTAATFDLLTTLNFQCAPAEAAEVRPAMTSAEAKTQKPFISPSPDPGRQARRRADRTRIRSSPANRQGEPQFLNG